MCILGKVSVAKIAEYAHTHQLCLLDAAREVGSQLSGRAAKSLAQFVVMVEGFKSYATSPVEEILGHILAKSGYEEFVADRETKTPFDPARAVAKRFKKVAFEEGLICYPMPGTRDGKVGDHVLLAPPFIASEAELDGVVDILSRALDQVLAG